MKFSYMLVYTFRAIFLIATFIFFIAGLTLSIELLQKNPENIFNLLLLSIVPVSFILTLIVYILIKNKTNPNKWKCIIHFFCKYCRLYKYSTAIIYSIFHTMIGWLALLEPELIIFKILLLLSADITWLIAVKAIAEIAKDVDNTYNTKYSSNT